MHIPSDLEGRLSKTVIGYLEGNWPIRTFDAILLPRFLHYFPDMEARALLSTAKEKLKNQGKVYLFEMLLPENTASGGLLDINMLVESGGKLRTLDHLKALLNDVGLKLTSLQVLSPHLHLLTGDSLD